MAIPMPNPALDKIKDALLDMSQNDLKETILYAAGVLTGNASPKVRHTVARLNNDVLIINLKEALKNKSVEIANLLVDLHDAAHSPSGLLFTDPEITDAENFMAVLEDLPLVKKLALIEWLHRTML